MKHWWVGICALALAGCAVGPNYKRPSAPVPPTFEGADGWKVSTPSDTVDRGPWWSVFNDPVLDSLVSQVVISNQNVRSFEAAYRVALATLRQSQSSIFPTASVSGSFTRSERGSGSTSVRGASGASTTIATGPIDQYGVTGSASWDIDVWGRIRRTIEANRDSAQASAADLANATLSAQAQLVTLYFELRIQDELLHLLDETVAGYQESFQIAQNKYAQGTSSKADLSQAETQLRSAQSQRVSTQLQREQFQHAIAVLVGKPPSELHLDAVNFNAVPPDIPIALPSTLLERRPDVASAERRMASANAQIGVAISAYFPDLTVSGSYGYSSTTLDTLFQTANRVWSFGPSLALNVLDFGSRSAQVARARASYDQEVATYRQAVLTAVSQVEDQLSAVKLLTQQNDIQHQAVLAAREAQRITRNEYRAGTVDFTTVATAQASALQAEQTELGVRRSQFTAAVSLIQALGGGWDVSQMTKK